jgi:hypothetical protein
MKLGRTARTILIVGAFVAAFYIIFQMKTQAEDEQRSLNIQLDMNEQILTNLADQKEGLQDQLIILEGDLAEAESALEESRADYPTDIQSIEYDEVLFNIAHQWDINITNITASDPSSRTVEVTVEPDDPEGESASYSVDYTITTFNITVEGKPIEPAPEEVEEFRVYIYQTLDDILSYFNSIVTGEDFVTGSVESVGISVPEPYTELELSEIVPGEEETDGETTTVGEEEGEETLEAKPATANINLVIYSYEGIG